VGKVEVPAPPFSPIDAAYVVRIDGATLQPEWARLLRNVSFGYWPVGAAPAPNGEVWVVGNVDASSIEVNFVRLSPTGDVVTGGRLDSDTSFYNEATHVAATPDGGFVIGGWWTDTAVDPDDEHAMVVSISPTGTIRWQKEADDYDQYTDQTVSGVFALRNGNVVAWLTMDRLALTDYTTVEPFTPAGNDLPSNQLNWDPPPEAATELWNGDVLLMGRSSDGRVGRLFAVNTSNWSRRWTKNLTSPSQAFSLPAATVVPPLCATTPVTGQACAVPDARCPSASARVCTCTAGAWSCGLDPATVDVGWSTGPVIPGPLWVRHDLNGDLVRSVMIDRTLARSPTGAYAARADGGLRETTFGTTSGSIQVLDTDQGHDAACGQSDQTAYSVSNGNYTWTPSGMLSGTTMYTMITGAAVVSDPLPLPTVTQGCSDEVCP
jgi:hypothetical protein